jgi:type IV pilus assembly protein PilW
MITKLRRQHGFTLAEMMVAVAIGLLLLAAMSSLFMNNSRAQSEIEKANRQIENGRYAIQLVGGDLRNAGFWGELDPNDVAAPTDVPNPCSTALADLRLSLQVHVQGYDNVSATVLSCLSDVKAGTDILVVRHAATCVAGVGTCDALSAGGPYFQASLCNNASELMSASSTDFYRLDVTSAAMDRHQRNCTTVAGSGTLASIRRFEQFIYFVANNNTSGDGRPTLKRAEITSSGSTISHTIVPLVEGVENIQLEYGLDTNNNGVADVFSTAPATHSGCAGTGVCAVTNWSNVVSVRLNMLARNLETSAGYSESKIYTLGNNSDGSANTVTAGSDGYKRHVFQSLVGLPNPAGRRM